MPPRRRPPRALIGRGADSGRGRRSTSRRASAVPGAVVEVSPDARQDAAAARGVAQVGALLAGCSDDPPADLARAWAEGGARAVGEGVGVKARTPPEAAGVWTVDGWTRADPERASRPPARRGYASSDSSGSSGSFSDSSKSSSSVSSSEGESLGCGRGWAWSEGAGEGGCCACMCPAPRGSAAKRGADGMVVPGSASLAASRRARFWNALALKEDNARFLLLALVLVLYMVFGALVFQQLEEENETRERARFHRDFDATLAKLEGEVRAGNVSLARVEALLYVWGNMTSEGHAEGGRRRWDFAGSFHFAYTVVSTIGECLGGLLGQDFRDFLVWDFPL